MWSIPNSGWRPFLPVVATVASLGLMGTLLQSRPLQQRIRRNFAAAGASVCSAPQVLLEHLLPPPDDPRFVAATTRTIPPSNATVALITMNRPQAANAMGKLFVDQFQAVLETLRSHSSTRCVVVASSSPKVFSAGADLKERRTLALDETEAFVAQLRQTLEDFANLEAPTIAAVEGVALGGGLELALAADLRVAASNAVLGFPEASLAIVPGAGGTQRLPRLVGLGRAKELVFTGRRIDGNAALEYGLVQQVVEPGRARDAALDMAWNIAANGPVAVRAAKFAMNEGMTRTILADALEVERQAYQQVLTTEDRLEGLQAFQEKRLPVYKGL